MYLIHIFAEDHTTSQHAAAGGALTAHSFIATVAGITELYLHECNSYLIVVIL